MKKLSSGSLLIEAEKPKHAGNLLNAFLPNPAKCSPHVSLNTSRGIIRCTDLAGVSEEEIVYELSMQQFTGARSITVFRDGIRRETNTIVLTFNSAILPKSLKIGYLNVGVDLYIPNPLQCYTCFKYGHHKRKCNKNTSEALCKHCGEVANTHDSTSCKNTVKCANYRTMEISIDSSIIDFDDATLLICIWFCMVCFCFHVFIKTLEAVQFLNFVIRSFWNSI